MDHIREFAFFQPRSKSLSEELKKDPNITIKKVDSSLWKEDDIDLSYKGEEFTLHFKKKSIYFFYKGRESSGFQGGVTYINDVKKLSKSVIDTIEKIINLDKSRREKTDELSNFFNELTEEEINDLLVDIKDLDILRNIEIEKIPPHDGDSHTLVGWSIIFIMKNESLSITSEKLAEYGSFLSLVSQFIKRVESEWEVESSYSIERNRVKIIKSVPR